MNASLKTIGEATRQPLALLRKAFQANRLYFDVIDPDPSSAIFLAGSYRSGTTWLSEVLTYDNRVRHMWEPFHSPGIAQMGRFPGRPRVYIRPEARVSEFSRYVRRILSGQIRHRRINAFNRSHLPRGRVVKCIHANLFLKWVRNTFPETPIVFLMRHPCAVVHSIRALNFHTDIDQLPEFLDQTELLNDHLQPFRNLIRKTSDPFDRAVLLWCIENYVPLRQFRRDEAQFVFYEHLCAEPRNYLPPIFQWTGRPFSDVVYEKLPIPSNTAWGDHSVTKAGRDPINNWRKHVTANEQRRALGLLRAFGLDAIYNDELMPTADGLDRFLGARFSTVVDRNGRPRENNHSVVCSPGDSQSQWHDDGLVAVGSAPAGELVANARV